MKREAVGCAVERGDSRLVQANARIGLDFATDEFEKRCRGASFMSRQTVDGGRTEVSLAACIADESPAQTAAKDQRCAEAGRSTSDD
jgi:hypothetical protein